jgi:hypothetical protein
MSYPQIEAVADLKEMKKSLEREGFRVALMRWKDTACEIAPDYGIAFRSLHLVY